MNAVTNISHLAHLDSPDVLKGHSAWILWRFEPNEDPSKKPRKIPYYVAGGRRRGEQGSAEDRSKMVTFDAARVAAARQGMDGVGYALLPGCGVVALDFDRCITNGVLHPKVRALLADTYAEYSPSGEGVRAFFAGELGNDKDSGNPEFGLEVFSTKGFVTVTGRTLEIVDVLGNANEVAPISQEVRALVAQRFGSRDAVAERTTAVADPLGLTTTQVGECLEVLPKDLDYDRWVMVGMALHHELGAAGFAVWHDWSKASPKYTTADYCAERWRSFGRAGSTPVTARSLVHLANQHGARITLRDDTPASAEDFDAVAPASAEPGKPIRFQALSLEEFTSQPPPEWLVKGVIPQAGLCVLYGESGSGKTFMALDIAMAMALGQPWRERRVRQCPIVYIAAEGAGGFRNRVVAALRHRGLRASDVPMTVINAAPNLLLKDDALDIVASIKAQGPCGVVIVDTFAQVMPGANENAGEDMGKALAHCRGIHRATGALVLLVHHSGKDASKGARGWSGLKAAADAELEVTRGPQGRALRVSKQKDGEDGVSWGFGLEIVPVGQDSDSEIITSCIVTEQATPEVGNLARPLGAKEAIVNQVIVEMAQSQTQGIEVAEVIKEAVARMPAPTDGKRDTRKQHAKRALDALTSGDAAPYWIDNETGCLCVL
jgi:hypothetical protein